MSEIESGDGLGTPAYFVPNVRCNHCGTTRRSDGKPCIECDHYINPKVDNDHQERKRLNYDYRKYCENQQTRRRIQPSQVEEI